MTRQERNLYVENNLGLVHRWLQKYRSLPFYEDIVAYGVLGMIEALDSIQGDVINTGYIKKYVCGYAIKYITRLEPMVYKVLGTKGTYEKVDCNSLDVSISTEEDSITFGDSIVDEYDAYGDLITEMDFEAYVDGLKINYKDKLLMFLDGYDRKEVAKAAGVSYEALRQQLCKLQKVKFV